MQHLLVVRDIDRIRILHGTQNFEGLCSAFEHFVKEPSLPYWRGWLDIFYCYNQEWLDSFFHYHQKNPSMASRAISLLLLHRQVLHVRGNPNERTCARQERLMDDMVLAMHGLLQPLQQHDLYRSISFILEAMLHVMDGKALNAQWRIHVIPQLSDAFREIFFWTQIQIAISHNVVRDEMKDVLSDCEDTELSAFKCLIEAYLSSDEQLAHGGADVVSFSTDPLCGDIFAIDMADYYFSKNENENARAWLVARLPDVPIMLNKNEWLDAAIDLLEEHAGDTDTFKDVLAMGIEAKLVNAIHLGIMSEDEPNIEALTTLANKGHSESMVELYQLLRDDEEQIEVANLWLLRAARVFNSDALYLLGNDESKEGLSWLNDAVQRLHGEALFEAGLGVLEGGLVYTNQNLEIKEDGEDFDPQAAIELLEQARDAGMGEAATMLFDVLSEHVDSATFFSLCASAGKVDPSYLVHGYNKALFLQEPAHIVEWSRLLLESKIDNRAAVLFQYGCAAFQMGQRDVAENAWRNSAQDGCSESIEKLETLANTPIQKHTSQSEGTWLDKLKSRVIKNNHP